MGVSWFAYAGTEESAVKGYILVPEYAQEWVGGQYIKYQQLGEYADFIIEGSTALNGHILIAAFEMLHNGHEVPVSFEDCKYVEYDFPYENEVLENMRHKGIDLDLGTPGPWCLKVTERIRKYERVEGYSHCGQWWDDHDEDYDGGYLDDEDYEE